MSGASGKESGSWNPVAKVEEFITKNPKYQEIITQVFKALDQGSGRITSDHATEAVDLLFEKLEPHMENMAVSIKKPSETDIENMFQRSDVDSSKGLNAEEFKKFYSKVLLYAAEKAGIELGKSYGAGVALGLVGVFAAKRLVRAIPVVGTIVSPVLGLFPTILVGPALGAVTVWAIKKDKVGEIKDRIFGKKAPNQFKMG
mmetsp:Transcript_9009/g.19361  ORF Transcript_9009/g.19361 Transcript_9009/m.19361 type:complete len:201 (+) Transcript_9009:113-715(+)|eukprot:CAMPEP_0202900836 /NCGR_PEP_ID=MMETSP1392-20130828/12064_1 /ASSEMBLY_ACC=CAM_ASM_000868 /TAXON_ID=225041 /ORGANISM="Chlamydomonas chlamydogama, Strain SAG 11-48b" /LENGTH=200 /DNA_ID=CAMNT_0049587289 /DNA_START=92 /DNA_END=694 /DNA_ORIENTATION=+